MNDYPIKAHYRAGTWRRYSINNPKNPSPNPCAVYLCRKWGKKLAAIKENDLKDRLLAAHHHRAVLWDTLSAINNVEVDEKSTRTNDGRPVLWWSLRPKPPPHLTIQKKIREKSAIFTSPKCSSWCSSSSSCWNDKLLPLEPRDFCFTEFFYTIFPR